MLTPWRVMLRLCGMCSNCLVAIYKYIE